MDLTKTSGPYYGVHIPQETPTDTEGFVVVYEDKIEALKAVKKHKKARFKAFAYYHEAAEFAIHGADVPQEKTVLQRTGAEPNTPVVAEKASAFRAPKSQDLVRLRKAIESGDIFYVRNTIWDNPRYLVSVGDTPSILQEGSRYNALHVGAKAKNHEMCELILNTVSDVAFIKYLYGDDQFQDPIDRSKILLDLYLNTPDKGSNESPLHFAAKFGALKVVELLVSFPQCDRNLRNRYGMSASEIICDRYDNMDIGIVKNQIKLLLQDNYYVPVLRSEDKCLPAVIGDVFSPGSPQNLNKHPLEPRVEIHAYAGPMNKSEAEKFRKIWKTPPRIKNSMKRTRNDHEKGLERLGKSLAEEYSIGWKEYWPFLDSFVDICSEEGLQMLENHIKGLYEKEFGSLTPSTCSVKSENDSFSVKNCKKATEVDENAKSSDLNVLNESLIVKNSFTNQKFAENTKQTDENSEINVLIDALTQNASLLRNSIEVLIGNIGKLEDIDKSLSECTNNALNTSEFACKSSCDVPMTLVANVHLLKTKMENLAQFLSDLKDAVKKSMNLRILLNFAKNLQLAVVRLSENVKIFEEIVENDAMVVRDKIFLVKDLHRNMEQLQEVWYSLQDSKTSSKQHTEPNIPETAHVTQIFPQFSNGYYRIPTDTFETSDNSINEDKPNQKIVQNDSDSYSDKSSHFSNKNNSQKPTESPISALCDAMSACTLNSMGKKAKKRNSLDAELLKNDFQPILVVEKSCEIFAERLAKSIFNLLENNDENCDKNHNLVLQKLSKHIKQLSVLVTSYTEDIRFVSVEFKQIHSRVALITALKLREMLVKFESVVNFLENCLECTSSDENEAEGATKRQTDNSQVFCVLNFVLEAIKLELKGKIGCDSEDDCYEQWGQTLRCNCSFSASNSKRTSSASKRNSFRLSLKNFEGIAKTGNEFSRKLSFDNEDEPSTSDLKDVVSSSEDDDYFTPPSSPSLIEELEMMSSDNEEFNETQVPTYDIYLEGDVPTKVDRDVFNALQNAKAILNPHDYPNVYKWHHTIGLYTEKERNSWMNARNFNSNSFIGVSTPKKMETAPATTFYTPPKNWLRITGPNSPKPSFRLSQSSLSFNL